MVDLGGHRISRRSDKCGVENEILQVEKDGYIVMYKSHGQMRFTGRTTVQVSA